MPWVTSLPFLCLLFSSCPLFIWVYFLKRMLWFSKNNKHFQISRSDPKVHSFPLVKICLLENFFSEWYRCSKVNPNTWKEKGKVRNLHICRTFFTPGKNPQLEPMGTLCFIFFVTAGWSVLVLRLLWCFATANGDISQWAEHRGDITAATPNAQFSRPKRRGFDFMNWFVSSYLLSRMYGTVAGNM